MILAIDVGGDRKSYGFELVQNSIRARYGDIVRYISNRDLETVYINGARVILLGFMFVENYLHIAKVFKKLELPLWAKDREGVIVIAGGPPISENPEPIAEFIDIGVIGEGEWAILEILEIIFRHQGEKSALAEIYEKIDCAYVPSFYQPEYDSDERVKSCSGRHVPIRREDPTCAVEIPGLYIREQRGANKYLEYSIEYHRGCKRRCRFCSYGYLQAPYREVNRVTYYRKVEELARYDSTLANKIISIQTNIFHFDLNVIKFLKALDKLPSYSSACFADMFSESGREIISFLESHGNIYFRFGIEDFTEEGRKKLGKHIPNWMIENLPVLFPEKGNTFKFFFITSLPWQTVGDIQEFEGTLNKMASKVSHYYTIDCFFTLLNYKLSAGMLEYKKEFKPDIAEYLSNSFPRRYGKLTLKVFKNQDELAFLEINLLSLGNRKLAPVLEKTGTGYSRELFVQEATKVLNTTGLLAPYTDDRLLPNWFIDYSAETKMRKDYGR